MKLHGLKLDRPKEEVVVIPRKDRDLIFKAKAVLEFSDFEKVCPVPTPPEVIRPGGLRAVDPNDAEYNKKLGEWATKKSHWMIIKSLSATEGLEWETVDMANPDSWKNYQSEMIDSGLSPAEISRLVGIVTDACGLNQDKIDEATNRFLAGQGATQGEGSSQSTVPNTTQSGNVANVSE